MLSKLTTGTTGPIGQNVPNRVVSEKCIDHENVSLRETIKW